MPALGLSGPERRMSFLAELRALSHSRRRDRHGGTRDDSRTEMMFRFSPEDTETWDRRRALVMGALPYALLAISLVLALVEANPAPNDRLITVGLAALAAAWVFVCFTWLDSRWPRQTAGRLFYIAGLLLISAILVAHSGYFIAFAVTCFVQSLTLLPTLISFVGVAISATIVFLVPLGFRVEGQEALDYGLIIVLETLLLGGFGLLGTRERYEHERRRQLVIELEQAMAENAGLQVQVLTQAREAGTQDERARMAREIHDTLAQGLTGIITQLEAAQHAGDRSTHVDQACALARESLTEARRSVQALRPAPLEVSRLPDAIEEMARRWSDTSSVALSFQTTGEPRPLLAELEVTLFRVAQEALTNVGRHAEASRVGLTLSYMDDVVLLDVRDDGAGFDPAVVAGQRRERSGNRFGMQAMRQRLSQVGGDLEIESSPGAGTAINARVPAIALEAGA
ncbi:MAG TPA: sensor histidine kinase [Candidatus Dormibacteraeota bacterium]|jgi:signal transduction histidine kinase|nr:sensor histidine kinase [Candidatus Dormibacteraeota bacterium]